MLEGAVGRTFVTMPDGAQASLADLAMNPPGKMTDVLRRYGLALVLASYRIQRNRCGDPKSGFAPNAQTAVAAGAISSRRRLAGSMPHAQTTAIWTTSSPVIRPMTPGRL